MIYLKAKFRGNELKMNQPRAWLKTVKTVTKVRTSKRGAPPEYQLDNEQPVRWVSHDRLQRVHGQKPVPLQLAQSDRDYTLVKAVPGVGSYYTGYPWPES